LAEKVILDKVCWGTVMSHGEQSSCWDTVMSRGEQSSQQQQELTVNEFYEQCAGKEDGGGGEGTRTRPKAKALAARAEATVRATVEKAR
jgi:hypothetical protein